MFPKDIRFSAKSIECSFNDGRTLEYTSRQLMTNEVTVDMIEPIEVFRDGRGHWCIIDGNRRLFICKILERFHLLFKIPVKVLDIGIRRRPAREDAKGMTVMVQNDQELGLKIEKLCKDFNVERIKVFIMACLAEQED
jgi:hypothetical protein